MIEVLVSQDAGSYWNVVGTQPIDKPVVDSEKSLIRASREAVEIAKKSLSEGKFVFFHKDIDASEVVPTDLVVMDTDDELERERNFALNEINSRISQNAFGVSVIDSMDYLDCMLQLMSVGIFITDENREDKYFEIIEAAQTTEEPKPLTQDSTFEDEQEYIERKRAYDRAQKNLATLEKYLNAYDKLSKVRFVHALLNDAKRDVLKAETKEDISKAVAQYLERLDKFFYEGRAKCTT